ADPNICPNARKIDRITYDEMMELASLGAKVLQIRSVEVASNYSVPLHVRSSFSEQEGTMVVADSPQLEDIVVTGVTLDADQCRFTLRRVPVRAGVQAELLRPLAEAGVVIDMIVQNPPEQGHSNISFTVHRSERERARALVTPGAERIGADAVQLDDEIAKVSIVGVGMRSHSGVAQRMFELLAGAEIEILMITTSEIKVSCLVPRRVGEVAVRALHAGFLEG
ncbi:MAG: ACT domain-containing protein, partial [Myxococcales bacterium]|nr:ACT domain-containing protein [Myxococcales bacterium]